MCSAVPPAGIDAPVGADADIKAGEADPLPLAKKGQRVLEPAELPDDRPVVLHEQQVLATSNAAKCVEGVSLACGVY